SIDPVTNLFVSQAINSVNLSASSSVVLFGGLSINNTIKQNEFAYEAAMKEVEVTQNNVMINIVAFYTDVLFTRELLENSRKQLNSIEQQVERTRLQVEAGALPRANLLDLQAQLATNDFNMVTAENNYEQAKVRLKLAMQLPPQAEVEIEVPDMDVEADMVLELTAYEIYQIALQNMPEIKAAEFNLESGEYGVKSAKGAFYPSIVLNGNIFTNYSDRIDSRTLPTGEVNVSEVTIGRVQSTNEPVVTNVDVPITTDEAFGFPEQINENLSQSVSLGMNIPIFNRFSARYDSQRAMINKDQAMLNKRDREYQLWQQIQQSYNDVEAAAKSYNSSLLQVRAREESFRVVEMRFNNGAANFVDYQVAENDYFNAQSDLLRAKYDLIFKQKILDFYQGKPLEF
ncbi:MAG: TolC family protein, partial [Cyclobacteriaceae bacterium]